MNHAHLHCSNLDWYNEKDYVDNIETSHQNQWCRWRVKREICEGEELSMYYGPQYARILQRSPSFICVLGNSCRHRKRKERENEI